MDKGAASSSRETAPRSPAVAPAERPYAGDYLADESPAGESLRDLAALARDGPRAAAQRKSLTAMFGPSSGAAVVQPKLAVAGKAKLADLVAREATDPLRRDVLEAFKANRALLEKLEVPKLEEMIDEFQRPLAFENNLRDLVNSPVDFGEFNLSNPQHVYLYAKEASRFLNSNYQGSQIKERTAEEERLRKAPPTVEPPPSPGPPENTCQVALLGTSASVADYITARAGELDSAKTLIIGKSQPWRPDPGDPRSRGIDFVNHPPSMTSPKRDETQLAKEASGADEGFKGNAALLANQIDEVLAGFGARKVDAEITKVSRDENGWYKVATDNGDFYARKVVSGLGIGPHKMEGQNKLAAKVTSGEDKAFEQKRVLDLDEFQRQASDPRSPLRVQFATKGGLLVGVSGPNAGVDAVAVATNLGMCVDWVVSADGPAIAEGMGNKISRTGLVDLYFDYLKGWTIVAPGYVQLEIGGKWQGGNAAEAQAAAEEGFYKKQPAWRGKAKRLSTKLVDYLVIAQGPDVAKLWTTFDPTVTKDLELKGDESGRFGGDASTKEGSQGTSATSLERANYNIRYEGAWNAVKKVCEAEKIQFRGHEAGATVFANVGAQLEGEALAILGVDEFAPITLQTDVATRLASKDDSFEVIGGSAIRILNYLDAQKDRGSVPEALRAGGQEAKMKKVLKTLSTPTLLNNDQLTPIRSQIEAGADYMPGYIGKQESNFVTDDQTMIAAQIASQYGDIPAALANWVTQKIIQDRNATGVRPGTEGGSRAFVDKWKGRLERLHVIFAPTRLKGLAEAALAEQVRLYG